MGSPSRPQPQWVSDLLSGRCPSQISHVADLYCLGRFTPELASIFEAHVAVCPACAAEVQTAQEFIAALKAVIEGAG